ncbi:MAG: amidohydrolase [Actinomycetota bacterium]|nr:amidohydrolase [Actinomycetota bacterium]
MPARLMEAVWSYFDSAPEHYGMQWPVQYRTSEDDRVATLRSLGVRTFTALLYPHKPAMAESLSAWAREFAARTPGCVSTGTFFPEPSAATYVRQALDAGTSVFKAHIQVGGYDPRDALLTPVWGMLADAGVPVVVHCGSGPLAGRHTGPGPFGAVMAAHPRLTAVVAHLGAPEYREHLDLATAYPRLCLDTTMAGTRYFDTVAPLPADVVARLGDLGDRIVLGTDFPNIPYPYAEQLEALQRLDLGDDWLRAVCWHNGRRLLGLEAPRSSVGPLGDDAR